MFILPGRDYVFQHIAPLDTPGTLAEVAAETVREYTGVGRPHYLEALHRVPPPGFEPVVHADFFAPEDARPLTAYADGSGQYVICQRPHERIEQQDLAWGELYEKVNRFEDAVIAARAEGTVPSRKPGRRQAGHVPDRSCPRAERVAPVVIDTTADVTTAPVLVQPGIYTSSLREAFQPATCPTGNGQWSGVYIDPGTASQASARIDQPPSWYTAFAFEELSAAEVEAYLSANAGARPLDRDAHDTRIVAELAARAGSIKDSFLAGSVPNEVSGGQNPSLAVNAHDIQAFITGLAAPHSDGDCGAMSGGFERTRLMCALEAHPTYGARRLEQYQGVP